ncbi:MAG: ABC transporter permease, partial [Alphaproteobacteria bacterium]|nr:ABC transporter permease [Alphaproteobacteria bacterium]
MGALEAIVLTIITAATPLLLAAIGELVVERSGVLNLGVEGMMVVGAVCAFAGAQVTGLALVGVAAGAVAGLAMALLFAVLTQSLITNQVATGLALTLLGLGLSGLIGEDFTGLPGVKLAALSIPGVSDLPIIGPSLFGQDILVYGSFLAVAGVAYTLNHSRLGLIIRAVGDNHHSAHALGYSVIGVRYGCILFGGLCAGLSGAYLSLAYTP